MKHLSTFHRSSLEGLFFIILIGNVFSAQSHLGGQASYSAKDQLRRRISQKFQITGHQAKTKIIKYIDQIQELANEANVSVLYKIKVEVKNEEHQTKLKPKKKVSKKFNVPLKKENMKLSTYEIVMKKLAEETGQKTQKEQTEPDKITNAVLLIAVTKQPFSGKYKPIISRVRTNYTKRVVKPVRNKEIVLGLPKV